MTLVLDIETVPCSEEVRARLPAIDPPSGVSGDPARPERWNADERPDLLESQYRRTAAIRPFLLPILDDLSAGIARHGTWPPGGPCRSQEEATRGRSNRMKRGA